MQLTIPHQYQPRPYQLPILQAIDKGYKHIYFLVHRRGGKDVTFWNAVVKRAFEVKGVHYYLLPEHKQARKVIFDGMTNDGFKFLDYIPHELIASANAQEMKITLKTGSIIQLAGTDNYNSLRGTNPITLAYSEYAYQNPMAREVLSPILRANGGIEMFNTTPNGHNHAKDLWDYAQGRQDWFTTSQNAEQTGVFTPEQLEEIRQEYITQGKGLDMFLQEYMNSFDAAIKGAYYGDEMARVKQENRICSNVYDKNLPVYTAWDIGYRDDTAITFYQIFGKEIRIVDYYANNGLTMPEYIDILRSKPYKYAKHYFPWDAKITPMSSGKSTIDVAREYGLDNIELTPQLSVQEGIQQLRMILQRCYFEKETTKELVSSLEQYHREYDEKRGAFRPTPYHDWSSHGADSARYMAISIKNEQPEDDIRAAQKFANGYKDEDQIGIKIQQYNEQQTINKFINESILFNESDTAGGW